MKKCLNILIIFIMMVCMLRTIEVTNVEAENLGDFDYEILEDDTVEIKQYNGSSVSVSIPSEIEGRVVTSIGYGAFRAVEDDDGIYQSNIQSVYLPDTIKYIWSCAFQYCTNLTEINIPESVISIGEEAFEATSIIQEQDSDVKYIGKWAIDCDSEVSSLVINNGTVGIADGAIMGDWDDEMQKNISNLSSVFIPDTVKYIGNSAFYECDKLKQIDIPESVVSIGEYAFTGTSWLREKTSDNPLVIVNGILIDANKCTGNVIIPDNVKSIASWAFGYHDNITSITISRSVNQIGIDAFGYMDDTGSKITDFKIYCYAGSYGEKFAKDNNFDYELLVRFLNGKVAYQLKKNYSALRFVALVDKNDLLSSDYGNYKIISGNEEYTNKIVKVYNSIFANGQIVKAPEGKCFVPTQQIVNVERGMEFLSKFNLFGFDEGISKTVLL